MPRLESTKKGSRRPMDYRQTTISLTPEIDDQLDAEADRLGLTRSAVVRLAIQAWVTDGALSGSSPSGSGSNSRGNDY